MKKTTRDWIGAFVTFAMLGTMLGFMIRDFVPAVEGRAVKMTVGRNVRLAVLTTDGGERSIAGDRDMIQTCKRGAVVRKPAFSSRFTCDGVEGGWPSWLHGLFLIVLMAGSGIAVFGIVTRGRGTFTRPRPRAR